MFPELASERRVKCATAIDAPTWLQRLKKKRNLVRLFQRSHFLFCGIPFKWKEEGKDSLFLVKLQRLYAWCLWKQSGRSVFIQDTQKHTQMQTQCQTHIYRDTDTSNPSNRDALCTLFHVWGEIYTDKKYARRKRRKEEWKVSFLQRCPSQGIVEYLLHIKAISLTYFFVRSVCLQ